MSQTVTIAGVTIAKIGHGLMSMTLRPQALSDEQCFETIKAGVDTLPPGIKAFLNTGEWLLSSTRSRHAEYLLIGEFYGVPSHLTANLELLNRFFTKYPEYAERTFLSVKGAMVIDQRGYNADASPAGLERSINNSIEKLGPNKKIDLFEPARVDPNFSIEDTMATLNKYVESGKIGSIGLSECSAATLTRASKVGKVAAVEIEVSPWAYEEETRKVIATAKEIGTVVAAYSPLGSGFLTGQLNVNELDKNDYRTHFPRFSAEAAKNNQNLVNGLKSIAERKGISPAQLSIAWVASLGPHVVPIPGSTRKDRTLENLKAASITLNEAEREEIRGVLEQNPVSGARYPESAGPTLLWG